MKREIILRGRQLGGSYQLIDPTPGADSHWSPKLPEFLVNLENYVKTHGDATIRLNLNSIYEGDKRIIRERMKDYRNLEII